VLTVFFGLSPSFTSRPTASVANLNQLHITVTRRSRPGARPTPGSPLARFGSKALPPPTARRWPGTCIVKFRLGELAGPARPCQRPFSINLTVATTRLRRSFLSEKPIPSVYKDGMAKLETVGMSYGALRKECLEAVRHWPGCETVAGIQIIRDNSPAGFSIRVTLYGKADKKCPCRKPYPAWQSIENRTMIVRNEGSWLDGCGSDPVAGNA
jgi:hypothetical protein